MNKKRQRSKQISDLNLTLGENHKEKGAGK